MVRGLVFVSHYFRQLARKFDHFIPIVLRGNTNELRRSRIILGASLSVGLLTITLSLARFIAEGWGSSFGWMLVAVSMVMLSNPLILRLTQSTLLAGSVIPTIGASTLITMAALQGGLESEAIYWFPFAPLIAAFFVNAYASMAFGTLMLLALLALYFGQKSGVIIKSTHPLEIMQHLKLMSAVTAVIFGAVVAWLYESNRRKSEAALQRSNAKTQAMVSAMPDTMFLVNPEGRVLDIEVSETNAISMPILRLADRTNYSIVDLFPALDDKERITTQLQRAIDAGSIQIEEYDIDEADQHWSIEVRIVPAAKGEVLAIIRDVTKERDIERLKNEFLSTVSHELRTPLTAIIGYIALLSNGMIPGIPDKARNMIDNVNRNAEQLSVIIDDLLDLQKISSGRMQYSMKYVQIGVFLKHCIELNQGYASKYNVRLGYNNQADDTNIQIDESRMQQVMANLISNAIKYSHSGGTVSVEARNNIGQVCISVKDKGAGIPEEFHGQVYEKFSQSDSSTTRTVGGTGLGLSISKMIIERHGGSIDFDSELGVGTTFYVCLPISKDF